MHSIRVQKSPSESGSPRVLIEGRPAVVLDPSFKGETPPQALPTVLVNGKPLAFVTSDAAGAVSVVASGK